MSADQRRTLQADNEADLDRELNIQNWNFLTNAVGGGLLPAASPTCPEGTYIGFLPLITEAFQAGAASAIPRRPTLFTIPQIPEENAPTVALWAYYSQGNSQGFL